VQRRARGVLTPQDSDCWRKQPHHPRSTRCKAETRNKADWRDQDYVGRWRSGHPLRAQPRFGL